MAAGRLHQFSPQRTAPEDLEAIMVAREPELNAVMARVRDSAFTQNRFHKLFVGPRGIGKTHLLAIINHRVKTDKSLSDRVRVAWLNEDETSSRFQQLLLRIFRSLSARYPDEYPASDVQQIMGLSSDEALRRLSQSLVDRTGDRVILLLIENLDAHFKKFTVEEQRRWRGFMQDHPIITTVATAQKLFDGVKKQDEPFFGFFDTQHLQPLTVDQTAEMLQKIASLHGDTALQQVLQTSKGRARLRVLHYLAGGNPRLYVLLSEFITAETLDEVIDTFEMMVDRQLTSYYQERLRYLAPLQQEIVQVLCRQRGAVSVKLIAAELFTTSQSISRQLKDLKNFGYVSSNSLGREAHYELSEPLMRLVMQVKETDSQQPLHLLVEFLQAWFERAELQQKLAESLAAGTARNYLKVAVESYEAFDARWMKLGYSIETELNATAPVANNESEKSPSVFESIGTPADQVAKSLINRGLTYRQQGDLVSAIRDFTSVIELTSAPVNLIAWALVTRGITHRQKGESVSAIRDYTSVIELTHTPVDLAARALVSRGITYGEQGDSASAIRDLTSVIELTDAPVDLVATALVNRGVAHGKQGDAASAIRDLTSVIELPGAPVDRVSMALFSRGFRHARQGRTDSAIRDYTSVIELTDAPVDLVANALINRGFVRGKQGDSASAIRDYTSVIELTDAPVDQIAKALFNRGNRHGEQGDTVSAICDYTSVIELPNAPVDLVAIALVNRGITHGDQGDSASAIRDYTSVIELTDASVDQVTKALQARSLSYTETGLQEEATADLARLIKFESDVLRAAARNDPSDFCGDLSQILFAVDQVDWQPLGKSILQRITELGMEEAFGQAIVRQLKQFRDAGTDSERLKSWNRTWQKLAKGINALKVPLGFLDVGIAYLVTKKQEVLLEIPMEERQIVLEAVGLSSSDL
jgi:tetratricopeptide (TPR) repeat protein